MGLSGNLRLGALGGPNTFGGDAANQMIKIYPEFSEVVYVRTAEEGLSFTGARHDAMCAPQQMARTGFHSAINGYVAHPDSTLHVIAEITHVYHCSLLLKSGASLAQVKEIRGHTGSISQSRNWLARHLPQARIHIVDTSSHEAAREVSQADGSIASVGTPGMAREFGLIEAAKEIDGGSCGNYWALSPLALFAGEPDRIVVAGRFDEDGTVGYIVRALAQHGYFLRTVFSQASGARLYEFDYVLWFGGKGRLSDVQTALTLFRGARLAGAYKMRFR